MSTIKLAPTNTPFSGLRDRVFKNSDILHRILSACEIQEIFKLSRTNHAMNEMTATLISGSQALQLLDRTFYPDSDLDLYLFSGREQDVGRYLLDIGYVFSPHKLQQTTFQATDKRGYKPDPRPKAYPKPKWHEDLQCIEKDESEVASDDTEEWIRQHYPSKEEKGRQASTEFRQNRHVYNFLKPDTTNPTKKLKIQLLVANRAPIETILTNFHSTAVLNVVSFEKAYSLYPKETFLKRWSFSLIGSHRECADEAFRKYKSRGWKIITSIPDYTSPPIRMGIRSLADHDEQTWTVPLPAIPEKASNALKLTQAASVPHLWREPVAATSWETNLTWAGLEGLELNYHLVGGRKFRYVYVAADEPEIDDSDEKVIFTGSKFTESAAYQYHAQSHRQVPHWEPPSFDTPDERLMAFLIKDFGPDMPYVEEMEEEEESSEIDSEGATSGSQDFESDFESE